MTGKVASPSGTNIVNSCMRYIDRTTLKVALNTLHLSTVAMLIACEYLRCSTQGRSNWGGVYRYIYPQKQSTLNFYVVRPTGSFFLFDPGQIRYRASVRLSSCFFYLLTDHNYTPPMKFLATPLVPLSPVSVRPR